jgi:hypothetical protein
LYSLKIFVDFPHKACTSPSITLDTTLRYTGAWRWC